MTRADSPPDHVHGGSARLEEVGGVLDGRDVAEDALPDVLWSGNKKKTNKQHNSK